MPFHTAIDVQRKTLEPALAVQLKEGKLTRNASEKSIPLGRRTMSPEEIASMARFPLSFGQRIPLANGCMWMTFVPAWTGVQRIGMPFGENSFQMEPSVISPAAASSKPRSDETRDLMSADTRTQT